MTACEDPTLLIGARPNDAIDARDAGTRRGGNEVRPAPTPPEAEDPPLPEDDEGEEGDDAPSEPIVSDPAGAVTTQGADRAVAPSAGEAVNDAADPPVAESADDGTADAGKRQPSFRIDASVPVQVDSVTPPDPEQMADGPMSDGLRPPPPPRPRFFYPCRIDYDCARYYLGVCERGRCVQCRTFLDCPLYSVCTADHMCVRRPTGG